MNERLFVLAGLTKQAKVMVSGAERKESGFTYGCFEPHQKGLPLYKYILEDGTVLEEGAGFLTLNGKTVIYKFLKNGQVVLDSTWPITDLHAFAE